jgi:hypothetical protein
MFEQIQFALAQRRPDLTVTACTWGDHLGAHLHAGGASIPRYDMQSMQSNDNAALAYQEQEQATSHASHTALWNQLQQDPWHELRLRICIYEEQKKQTLSAYEPRNYGRSIALHKLRSSRTTNQPDWQELDARLHTQNLPLTLQIKLATTNISDQFNSAQQVLFSSSIYQQALLTITNQTEISTFASQLARVLIALTLQQTTGQPEAGIINPRLRDEIVALLTVEFTRSLHGDILKPIGQWQQLTRSLFTRSQQERRRRVLLDMFTPFMGDIIFYQARGEQLRELLLEHIRHVTPPITLLAHSLGGVACVDILVQHHLPEVHTLVTAGSQAPLLYEMDMLQSLPFGQSLPAHFPPWLNIYDMRDILSYVGGDLFPGRIQDVRVNNRHAYPQAHNIYWTNPETWQAVLPMLPPTVEL